MQIQIGFIFERREGTGETQNMSFPFFCNASLYHFKPMNAELLLKVLSSANQMPYKIQVEKCLQKRQNSY